MNRATFLAMASTGIASVIQPFPNSHQQAKPFEQREGLLSRSNLSVPIIPTVASNNTGTSSGKWSWQVFKTEPSLNPPVLEINDTGKPLSPGYVFIAPSNIGLNSSMTPLKQSGPMIMTDQGMIYVTNDERLAGHGRCLSIS